MRICNYYSNNFLFISNIYYCLIYASGTKFKKSVFNRSFWIDINYNNESSALNLFPQDVI